MQHIKEIKALIGSGNVENIELAFVIIQSQGLDKEIFLKAYRILFNLEPDFEIAANWLSWEIESAMLLNLSARKLETVPEEIEYLRNLTVVWLNSNSLKSLPDAMSRLKKLEALHLGNNQFTEIPKVLYEIEKLSTLSLLGNKIVLIDSASSLKVTFA
jgi:Leucine-rich repeat (LRR) protein